MRAAELSPAVTLGGQRTCRAGLRGSLWQQAAKKSVPRSCGKQTQFSWACRHSGRYIASTSVADQGRYARNVEPMPARSGRKWPTCCVDCAPIRLHGTPGLLLQGKSDRRRLGHAWVFACSETKSRHQSVSRASPLRLLIASQPCAWRRILFLA